MQSSPILPAFDPPYLYILYLHSSNSLKRAKPATNIEMTQFHTDEYVEFLKKVTPDNMESYQKEQGRFNVGDDCPVFDGLFEFCGISAGGSMEGAARLNRQKCDVAVNWAGGLHHAKKSEASGFCYINGIVLTFIYHLNTSDQVSSRYCFRHSGAAPLQSASSLY